MQSKFENLSNIITSQSGLFIDQDKTQCEELLKSIECEFNTINEFQSSNQDVQNIIDSWNKENETKLHQIGQIKEYVSNFNNQFHQLHDELQNRSQFLNSFKYKYNDINLNNSKDMDIYSKSTIKNQDPCKDYNPNQYENLSERDNDHVQKNDFKNTNKINISDSKSLINLQKIISVNLNYKFDYKHNVLNESNNEVINHNEINVQILNDKKISENQKRKLLKQQYHKFTDSIDSFDLTYDNKKLEWTQVHSNLKTDHRKNKSEEISPTIFINKPLVKLPSSRQNEIDENENNGKSISFNENDQNFISDPNKKNLKNETNNKRIISECEISLESQDNKVTSSINGKVDSSINEHMDGFMKEKVKINKNKSEENYIDINSRNDNMISISNEESNKVPEDGLSKVVKVKKDDSLSVKFDHSIKLSEKINEMSITISNVEDHTNEVVNFQNGETKGEMNGEMNGETNEQKNCETKVPDEPPKDFKSLIMWKIANKNKENGVLDNPKETPITNGQNKEENSTAVSPSKSDPNANPTLMDLRAIIQKNLANKANEEKKLRESKTFNPRMSSLNQYTQKSEADNTDKSQTVVAKKIYRFKSELIDEMLQRNPPQLDNLKTQVNSSPIGTIVLNKKDNIVQYNSYITDKLFYDRKKLLDHDIYSIIPPQEYLSLKAKMEDMKETNTNIFIPFKLKLQDSNLATIELECTCTSVTVDGHQLAMLQCSPPQEKVHQVIEHKSTLYVWWILLIAGVLIFLLVQMPQDMAFQDSKTVDSLEVPLTIIFALDIIINFNLSQDNSDDITIQDRQQICTNQLFSWFLIDFISSIPSSMLFDKLINTQIFKGLKIIRIFRFFKLMRLLRLTKIYSVMRLISEGDMKRMQKWLKTNQGYLDLLKNMFYIYTFAHFYTIAFWGFENFQCQTNDNCWKNFYISNLRNEQITDQHQILYRMVMVALGLGAMDMQNDVEVYISILWMFIGLSMFGYGIGNISSYLNQANKQDLEYMETLNYFNELCIMNNLDPRLQNVVMGNLEQNFSKQMDRELQHQASTLSSHVFDQLELSLLEKFVGSFKLFEKLNVKILRLIKHHMLIENHKVILRKGNTFKDLQMVQEGSIGVQDAKMQMLNFQESGEIQGLNEQFEYIKHKYKVDVETEFKAHMDLHENKIKTNLAAIIAQRLAGFSSNVEGDPIKTKSEDRQSLLKRLITAFELNNVEFKAAVSINDDFLTCNQNAICSDNVKQIVLPFNLLEEILFTDVESFQFIQKQDQQYNRELSDDEIIKSDQMLTSFKKSEEAKMMLTLTGEVYDVNETFLQLFGLKEEKEIVNYSIFEILNRDFEPHISKMAEQTEEDTQNFIFDNREYKVKTQIEHKFQIIKYKYSKSLNLHKYAKSLMNSNILTLSIDHGYWNN